MTAVLGDLILGAHHRQIRLCHMIRRIILIALTEEHVERSDKHIAAPILQMRSKREMQLTYYELMKSCRRGRHVICLAIN
ncbi:hypothetical protein D3C79_1093110 [compost metagenome]